MSLRTFVAILVGLIGELTDERAYRQYLTATGCQPSREAWKKFSDNRLRSKYRQGRCC